MSNPISWTDQTWNPVTGCTKISPGCKNCYAERISKRLAGRAGYPPAPDNFKVTLHPGRLGQPLRWRKPRMVFVCSMGDLFHIQVPQTFIEDVFRVIAQCPQHIFQILTKRPEKMKEYAKYLPRHLKVSGLPCELSNVWWGVTIENQKAADERRAAFEQTPAAVKFVSYEPALGPVDWTGWEFIDMLIAGGETGPGARPAHPDWFRAARDWSQAAGVAFHHKHNGEWLHGSDELVADGYGNPYTFINDSVMFHVGKKRAGHLLDGERWRQMPEVKKCNALSDSSR